MHIQHIEVGNFRKLKAVRIDFSETSTVFVGANNSGKTSAMVALRVAGITTHLGMGRGVLIRLVPKPTICSGS